MINNMRKAVLLYALAITLSNMVIGCTAIKFSDYPVKPLNQYYLSQTKDNLFIGIEPFYDKKKIEEYFGVDLLSHNILPVFIVVENHNPASSFVLLKEQFNTSKVDTKKYIDSSTSQSVNSAYSGTIKAGNVLVTAGVVLVPPLLLGIGQKMQANGSAIKYNLITKELQSESIPFTKSQQGFVYFQFKNNEDINTYSILNLKALNLKSNEIITYTFNMK